MTTLLSPLTPGPWTVGPRRSILGKSFDGVAREIVASVHGGSPEAAHANAYLIAAAPVMFETLQAIWRLVEGLDIGTREKAQIRDLIYPAIDEARGPYPRVGTP
jgi:hypothetical protein